MCVISAFNTFVSSNEITKKLNNSDYNETCPRVKIQIFPQKSVNLFRKNASLEKAWQTQFAGIAEK